MAVAPITVHNYSRHIVYDMPPVLMEYRQRVFTHYHFPKHHGRIHCIVVSLLYVLSCYCAHIWFIKCTHYESYMRVITCWVAWTHIAALVRESAWRRRTGDKPLHEPKMTLFVSKFHYTDVIMDTKASQITSLTIVYSVVYSDADQRKHQSSASLAYVRGIHRGPANSPHKWPVTWKMFPFDDVIMFMTRHRYAFIHTHIHYDQIWFDIVRYNTWYGIT